MNFCFSVRRPLAVMLSLVLLSDGVGRAASDSQLFSARRAAVNRTAARDGLAWAAPAAPPPSALVRPSRDIVLPPVNALAVSEAADDLPAGSGAVYQVCDIHRNDEAQRHVAELLQRLVTEKDVAFIALEGAWGPIPVGSPRRYAPEPWVERAADFLLRSHLISGPVYAAWTAPRFPPLVGIDDKDLYAAHVAAYRAAERRRPALTEWTASADRRLEAERPGVTPALGSLAAMIGDFRSGRARLADYYATLARSVNSGRFPATERFLALLAMERQIDFDAVRRERSRLLARLFVHADDNERGGLDALIGQASADPVVFHTQLLDRANVAGVPLSAFPNFVAYVRYVTLAREVRASALAGERWPLEEGALSAVARTAADRTFVQAFETRYLVGRLGDFALSPIEWESYESLPPGALPSAEIRRPFEEFYRLAKRRDAAMCDRLAALLSRYAGRDAVVVTGGFHAPAVERLVRSTGRSLRSLTPRLSKPETTEATAYLSAFDQQATPLELLVRPTRLYLAAPPLPASGRRMLAVLETAVAERANGSIGRSASDERRVSSELAGEAAFSVEARDVPGTDEVSVSVHAGPVDRAGRVAFGSNGEIASATMIESNGGIHSLATAAVAAAVRLPGAEWVAAIADFRGWPTKAASIAHRAASAFRHALGAFGAPGLRAAGTLQQVLLYLRRDAGAIAEARALEDAFHHARIVYPELSGRDYRVEIGRHAEAVAELDGITIRLHDQLLRYPDVLTAAVDEEMRHLSFRFLLRFLWGQRATAADRAAEEIDSVLRKIDMFRKMAPRQQAAFLSPLIRGLDQQKLYHVFIRSLSRSKQRSLYLAMFKRSELADMRGLREEILVLDPYFDNGRNPTSALGLTAAIADFFVRHDTFPDLTPYYASTSALSIWDGVEAYRRTHAELQREYRRRVRSHTRFTLVDGVDFELRNRAFGAAIDGDSGVDHLLNVGTVFQGQKVVAVEPHMDDLIFAMGATLRQVAKTAKSVKVLTANPDDLGVTDEYVEGWLHAHEGGEKLNGISEERRRRVKRFIRDDESKEALAAYGFDTADYHNLDIGLPVQAGGAVYEGGVFIPQKGRFRPLTAANRHVIHKLVEEHLSAGVWLLPYPFTKTPHHPHHEMIVSAFLQEMATQGYAGLVVFYETVERETDFDREGVLPNFVVGFDDGENEWKKDVMRIYRSQEGRKVGDDKYSVKLPARTRRYADIETARAASHTDGVQRPTIRPGFVERFLIGQVVPATTIGPKPSAQPKKSLRGGRWDALIPLYDRWGSAVAGRVLWPVLVESGGFVFGLALLIQPLLGTGGAALFAAAALLQGLWHFGHGEPFTRDRIAISVAGVATVALFSSCGWDARAALFWGATLSHAAVNLWGLVAEATVEPVGPVRHRGRDVIGAWRLAGLNGSAQPMARSAIDFAASARQQVVLDTPDGRPSHILSGAMSARWFGRQA